MLEDLQRIAEELAVRLGRSIAIDDPQLRLLVHTAHGDAVLDRIRMTSIMQRRVPTGDDGFEYLNRFGITKAVDPVRIPADPAAETLGRVCVPIRSQGILFGYLWLLDPDESMSDGELAVAVESAQSAGEIFFRSRLLGDRHQTTAQDILRDLLSLDPNLREDAAERLSAANLIARGSEVVALVVGVDSDGAEFSTRLTMALRSISQQIIPWQSVWIVKSDTSGVLLLGGRSLPGSRALEDIGQRLRSVLAETLPGHAVHVGIGPTVSSPVHAHKSHRCARNAMRVAALVPDLDAVASWESLGIYRFLIQLPLDDLNDAAIPDGLLRLIEADGSGVMRETLETYLDEAGSVPTSITRLSIHRTTLYYRLHRIEEMTGMSLSDGGDRLALHLATKLIRLTGAGESA